MNEIDPAYIIFIKSLLSALLLSFVPLITYRFTNIENQRNSFFEFTLLVTVPIIFLIMYFIGSNIALSIGLVGSLSVIRFRTAIKSPKELIYLLFAISIGVGLGSQNYLLTATGSLTLALFIVITEKFLFKSSHDSGGSFYLLKVNTDVLDEFLSKELSPLNVDVISIYEEDGKTNINLKSYPKNSSEKIKTYQQLSRHPKTSHVELIGN